MCCRNTNLRNLHATVPHFDIYKCGEYRLGVWDGGKAENVQWKIRKALNYFNIALQLISLTIYFLIPIVPSNMWNMVKKYLLKQSQTRTLQSNSGSVFTNLDSLLMEMHLKSNSLSYLYFQVSE